MGDSYPTFLTWILWVLAGICVASAALIAWPAGQEVKDRGQSILSGLMIGMILWGISLLTHGDRAADKAKADLRAANQAVAEAQRNYDQANAADVTP